MVAWSYSGLSTFERCPKQFKLVRIDKRVKDVPGKAAQRGIKVHNEIEARIKNGTPLSDEIAWLDPVIEQLLNTPHDICEAEKEIAFTKDLTPCKWTDWNRVWHRSKLDVYFEGGGGTVGIAIDWKTGGVRTYQTQADTYAAVLFKYRPKLLFIQVNFFFIDDKSQAQYTYDRKIADDLWDELMVRVQALQDADADDCWPAQPGEHCRWCAASIICEEKNGNT